MARSSKEGLWTPSGEWYIEEQYHSLRPNYQKQVINRLIGILPLGFPEDQLHEQFRKQLVHFDFDPDNLKDVNFSHLEEMKNFFKKLK